MRTPITIAVILVLLLAVRATACSDVSCLDRGIELSPEFVVHVSHANHSLSGVRVEISASLHGEIAPVFVGKTDRSGKVRVSRLAPGDYWIKAELFGIIASLECFHVASTPTRKAKGSVSYEWG